GRAVLGLVLLRQLGREREPPEQIVAMQQDLELADGDEVELQDPLVGPRERGALELGDDLVLERALRGRLGDRLAAARGDGEEEADEEATRHQVDSRSTSAARASPDAARPPTPVRTRRARCRRRSRAR